MEMKFDIQLFAETEITSVDPTLVMTAYARETWKAGLDNGFFKKFTGDDADYIVHMKTELKKEAGDSITIPLLLPLTGAGVTGDNILEGNEEQMIYRSFNVPIDQIRNAVRIKGKMEEKKTQLNLRKDAKTSLVRWLSTKTDRMIFDKLSTNPTQSTNPSYNRLIFGGSATSENTIGAADTFKAEMIGKAKRLATADENTMIKPVQVDGIDTYVMIIDPCQARDLMNDPVWRDAQTGANIRGKDNPIFSGNIGMYEGVVVHVSPRIWRTTTGASGTKVGHALFLGAQAAVFAVGDEPVWVEDTFDYENQVGFKFGRIFGIAKAQFKYDGVNPVDFGCINVLTASEDD